MTTLFDLICAPFRGLAPVWALIIISLVAGVIFLWIFGKVSNQTAIRIIRDRIRGNLIGVRLFQYDVSIVLRLQAKIIWDTFVYMRYSLMPMVILMIPALLIMTQLNLRFASRPLTPGEETILEIRLKDGEGISEGAKLEAPPGLIVETPPVHDKREGRIDWRLRAEKPGKYQVKIEIPKGTLEKSVIVGEGWGPVPSLRAAGLMDQFFFPGEPPIPADSPFSSARVDYPNLHMTVFGFSLNWIVGFLLFSLVSGFACKDLLGVEF